MDSVSYTTCVRVSAGEAGEEVLQAQLAALPATLRYAYNLGAADVFPATSGKAAALRYVAQRWGIAPESARCCCMGDDDNDIAMTRAVSHAFLPGVNAPTLAAAVAAEPGRYTVATRAGFDASAESLRAVMEYFARPSCDGGAQQNVLV